MGEGLYRELAKVSSVPDEAGELSQPAAVLLRPGQVMWDGGRKWLAESPDAEGEGDLSWVHPSVETRERRPRAERLGCPGGALRAWLENVAAEGTGASSARALSLVEALFTGLNQYALPEVKAACIVLSGAIPLEAADGSLCFPVEGVSVPEGISVVHAEVLADKSAHETLPKEILASVNRRQ